MSKHVTFSVPKTKVRLVADGERIKVENKDGDISIYIDSQDVNLQVDGDSWLIHFLNPKHSKIESLKIIYTPIN